ncbi:bulb-type lectin domain-containing protein [Artemisia annua]|uniref:Bulb-type lectin domain-containing protein n=1 Tax=Artemisia annua TaxID=35608 RepID=A0A2U1MS87_ARTAN|nr:bulb-type lectin domain-containing protein [Artemisia annua]
MCRQPKWEDLETKDGMGNRRHEDLRRSGCNGGLKMMAMVDCNPCSSETDTLHQGQLLKDWDELISSNDVFSLKFFGFHTTISPYLGIFYNENDKDKLKYRYQYDSYNKVVWVANRNNPIPDIYGNLMIDIHGKLSLLSSGGTVLDSVLLVGDKRN